MSDNPASNKSPFVIFNSNLIGEALTVSVWRHIKLHNDWFVWRDAETTSITPQGGACEELWRRERETQDLNKHQLLVDRDEQIGKLFIFNHWTHVSLSILYSFYNLVLKKWYIYQSGQ